MGGTGSAFADFRLPPVALASGSARPWARAIEWKVEGYDDGVDDLLRERSGGVAPPGVVGLADGSRLRSLYAGYDRGDRHRRGHGTLRAGARRRNGRAAGNVACDAFSRGLPTGAPPPRGASVDVPYLGVGSQWCDPGDARVVSLRVAGRSAIVPGAMPRHDDAASGRMQGPEKRRAGMRDSGRLSQPARNVRWRGHRSRAPGTASCRRRRLRSRPSSGRPGRPRRSRRSCPAP